MSVLYQGNVDFISLFERNRRQGQNSPCSSTRRSHVSKPYVFRTCAPTRILAQSSSKSLTSRFDLAHASREADWRASTDSRCGPGTSSVLNALTQTADARTVAITLGESNTGGGQVAASLILRAICFLDEMRIPPTKVLVVPDRLSTRQGYLQFRIAPREVVGLMDAWRLRAAAAGRSPGNRTAAERSLIRRTKRVMSEGESTENLHLFFPAYRMVDGTLQTVASRDYLKADDSAPAVTFVDMSEANVADLEKWEIDPDWLIFDGGTNVGDLDARDIVTICQRLPRSRCLCVVRGLTHPLINKLRGVGFRVCWLLDTAEGDLVASTAHFKCCSVESSIALDGLHRVLEILEDGRKLLRERASRSELAAFYTLRSALVGFGALPVERSYYDAAAVERFGVPTTDELLRSLQDHARELSLSSPAFAAGIDEAKTILEEASTTHEGPNSRGSHLIRAVEKAIGDGTGLCVIVRNRTTRSAVEAFLTDMMVTDLSELVTLGIRIESRNDLRVNQLPHQMPLLWTSYGGNIDLDRVLTLGATSVSMLVNPLERELLANDLRSWANRGIAAQQGTEALGLAFPGKAKLLTRVARLATEVLSAQLTPARAAFSSDVSRFFEEIVPKKETPSSVGAEDRTSPARPARAVYFESGDVSYFPDDGFVTVVRKDEEEFTDVGVGDLRPGDRIVFVNREIGRTIYELMQDELKQSPLVGASAQIVSIWHRALASSHTRRGLSVHDLHKELRQHGSKIKTTQTVRYWLRGGVIGPRDSDDIDRLAAIFGIGQRDGAILNEIKGSIRSLRSVYQGFAKIVYHTILTGGTGRSLSEREYRLLEEHGISLSDLRSAVTTETVIRVAEKATLRPASVVGKRSGG